MLEPGPSSAEPPPPPNVSKLAALFEKGKRAIGRHTPLDVDSLSKKFDRDAVEKVREKISGILHKDKAPKSSFDTQWDSPTKMKLADGKLHDVIDLTPEAPTEKPPVVIISGWNNPYPPKDLVAEMVARGRRVVFLNDAHGGTGNLKSMIDAPELNLGEEVELVAQSQGAIMATALALESPQIRRMVLLNPVLEGKGIARRFATEVLAHDSGEMKELESFAKKNPEKAVPFTRREVHREIGKAKVAAGSVASTVLHPVASIREVRAMGKAQIAEGLQTLNERGVKTTIIGGNHDLVVPMGRLQKTANSGNVVGFVSTTGDHGFGGKNYGRAIDSILTDMKTPPPPAVNARPIL